MGLRGGIPLTSGPFPPMNKTWATWHNCGCYVETLGQGHRFYPCKEHDMVFRFLITHPDATISPIPFEVVA